MTGLVTTVSADWCKHVLMGIGQGVREVDYWTNDWLPTRDIDRLEVYRDGQLFLTGEVISTHKAAPKKVFGTYMGRGLPSSIGLTQDSAPEDFTAMMATAFRQGLGAQIGNIVFRADGISFAAKIEIEAVYGGKVPAEVGILPPGNPEHAPKSWHLRRIVYI